MKIALPQINYYVGNISRNCEAIIAAIQKAKSQKADLVVFPEHAICGAYPQDLLEKEYFVNDCRLAIEKIAAQCDTIAAIVGAPNLDLEDGILYNAVFFMYGREVRGGVNKCILSDYDTLDESRYFIADEENNALFYQQQRIRVLFDEYEANAIQKNDDIIIHAGVTPFTRENIRYRHDTFADIARKHGKTVISLNHVGANGSLLFDGNTFVFNEKGELCLQLSAFEEDFAVVDSRKLKPIPDKVADAQDVAVLHDALIRGIRDFFHKNNFKKAILGLSGGIDSAVVAALAAEALGASNVLGILMPSKFSTDHSVTDAEDLVKKLGINSEMFPIKDMYDSFLNTLHPMFKDLPFNVAEENLQARVRGVLLMAISNKFGHILLNTSNKSEAAVGYGTLYGDMCGSLSVLGDVYKTEVYQLARYLNREKEVIPVNTITKAPSAELRPGQKDQDSLPDYETLDKILKLYLEDNRSRKEIIAQGFPVETVERVFTLVNRCEYKRAQCPPILKVSKKAFGHGRRMPLTYQI